MLCTLVIHTVRVHQARSKACVKTLVRHVTGRAVRSWLGCVGNVARHMLGMCCRMHQAWVGHMLGKRRGLYRCFTRVLHHLHHLKHSPPCSIYSECSLCTLGVGMPCCLHSPKSLSLKLGKRPLTRRPHLIARMCWATCVSASHETAAFVAAEFTTTLAAPHCYTHLQPLLAN